MVRFLDSLRVRNFSDLTVSARASSLRLFVLWCCQRGLTRPTIITRPILQAYQRHLFFYRQGNGKPLSASTQAGRLASVRMYFKWLTRENVLLSNPASELDMPRQVHQVPRQVLTPREAEAVLAEPDVTDFLGLRNRAILEMLYSTGMRRMEITGLKLFDVNWSRGTLLIRAGKGGRDRTVPIGERALAWADLYLREVRHRLTVGQDEGHFFLTREGDSILGARLGQMVSKYVTRADIGKTGACHLFRHAAATAMLENGADIRYIQELLGHATLETTEIYTKVSIRKLKEIHSATHPSARLGKPKAGLMGDEGEGSLIGLDAATLLELTRAMEEDKEETEPEAGKVEAEETKGKAS